MQGFSTVKMFNSVITDLLHIPIMSDTTSIIFIHGLLQNTLNAVQTAPASCCTRRSSSKNALHILYHHLFHKVGFHHLHQARVVSLSFIGFAVYVKFQRISYLRFGVSQYCHLLTFTTTDFHTCYPFYWIAARHVMVEYERLDV